MRFPPFADLDKDQRNIYVESPTNGAILVTGPPGTGKTVIAMHRALRLSGDKRNVAIVMFNRVLCRYTSNFENLPNNIDVKHMHKWASEWLRSMFQNKVPKLNGFTFDWKKISETIRMCSDRALINKMSWGHLIVDEGQDFDVGMYKALMNVVRHPLMDENLRPTLTVFADENQSIFTSNSSIIDLCDELNVTVEKKRLWRIDKNYRNSSEIAKFARYFQIRGQGSVQLPERESGFKPIIFFNKDSDAHYSQIVNMAVNFGSLEVGVIVFGTKKNVINTYVGIKRAVTDKQFTCRVQCYSSGAKDDFFSNEGNLIFDSPPSITIVHSQSAKGLEFDIVFLVNMSSLQSRDSGEVESFKKLYVTSSRARQKLFGFMAWSPVENWYPDPMRLLPSPFHDLCDYIDGESDGKIKVVLNDTHVQWLGSASQHARNELLNSGDFDKIMNTNVNRLREEFRKLSKLDFDNQEIETIIDNRLSNRDDVASLIIEIGHKVVIKSFKKNGILT